MASPLSVAPPLQPAAGTTRPRVFIGSSSRSRQIAEKVMFALAGRFAMTPWWKAFPPGDLTLDTLMSARGEYDCAVLVFAKDDSLDGGGPPCGITRDNVLLEFGLFLASLGKSRVLVLAERGVRQPSDLSGWTYLYYSPDDQERLDNDLSSACDRIAAKWDPLPPVASPPRPRLTDTLGFGGTLLKLAQRIDEAIESVRSHTTGSPGTPRQPTPVRFDLSRACISTYADALDLVSRRFWTTTFLSSGFWSTTDSDVIDANLRLAARTVGTGDLRRLFLAGREPDQEITALREQQLLMRRLNNREEVARMDDAYAALDRNIRLQLQQGFDVRIGHDRTAAWRNFPADLDFHRDDSEIAIYDNFRFDVFSGGRSGTIHSVHCYTELTENFQGFLVPAEKYFLELWEKATPMDEFLGALGAAREQANYQIDYEPHWLAQYEFALSADDERLKTVELSRALEILRKLHRVDDVGHMLDIGTCTGRYPIHMSPHVAPGQRIIGIDADPDCVRFASALVRKAQLENRVTIRRLDFLGESFPVDGRFGLVTCMLGTLSHFGRDRRVDHRDSLQRSLTRMASLLDEDGMLLVSNWSEQACEHLKLIQIYRHEDKQRLASWTARPDELKARFEEAGLEVVEEAQPDERLDLFACRRRPH